MRETLPPNSMMVCCLYFDWFIEYFLAWIIQQSYWLVCWIIFVMGCCFGFDDCLLLWFCYCLGWLITHWILVMSWLFWFICVVWLIDFLLVYGYALVVMICLCDVMGVGCFEMLSVCLRLWRMGRWARAILTYIYYTYHTIWLKLRSNHWIIESLYIFCSTRVSFVLLSMLLQLQIVRT